MTDVEGPPVDEGYAYQQYGPLDGSRAAVGGALHVVVQVQTTSPIADPPSFTLDFATTTGPMTTTDAGELLTVVKNSMTAIPTGGTHSPSAWYSGVISRVANSGTIKVYDVSAHLDGSPAGSPVATGVFTPSAKLSVNSLPEGLAIAITEQAPYGTDVEFAPGSRPRARDRGRIYMGPLDATATTTDANGAGVVASSPTTDFLQWIKSIALKTLTTSANAFWLGVWSRVGGWVKQLAQAYIDNRPDYIRLRADQGTSRTAISLP
jgi:hypothetical protein